MSGRAFHQVVVILEGLLDELVEGVAAGVELDLGKLLADACVAEGVETFDLPVLRHGCGEVLGGGLEDRGGETGARKARRRALAGSRFFPFPLSHIRRCSPHGDWCLRSSRQIAEL